MIELLLQADTTSVGYQIGYKVGTWLPVTVILTLAIMVLIRSYRFKNRP